MSVNMQISAAERIFAGSFKYYVRGAWLEAVEQQQQQPARIPKLTGQSILLKKVAYPKKIKSVNCVACLNNNKKECYLRSSIS